MARGDAVFALLPRTAPAGWGALPLLGLQAPAALADRAASWPESDDQAVHVQRCAMAEVAGTVDRPRAPPAVRRRSCERSEPWGGWSRRSLGLTISLATALLRRSHPLSVGLSCAALELVESAW